MRFLSSLMIGLALANPVSAQDLMRTPHVALIHAMFAGICQYHVPERQDKILLNFAMKTWTEADLERMVMKNLLFYADLSDKDREIFCTLQRDFPEAGFGLR